MSFPSFPNQSDPRWAQVANILDQLSCLRDTSQIHKRLLRELSARYDRRKSLHNRNALSSAHAVDSYLYLDRKEWRQQLRAAFHAALKADSTPATEPTDLKEMR